MACGTFLGDWTHVSCIGRWLFTTEPPGKFSVQLLGTPWTTPHQASLSFTISWSLLKLMSIELVIPSNHLILCHPSPLALSLSKHQVLFQSVSSSHQVAKVLELQLPQVLPMNTQGWFHLGLTGLISLQSKGLSRVFSSITIWGIDSSALACFIVQLSHPHMTTGKTIALARWTLSAKVSPF